MSRQLEGLFKWRILLIVLGLVAFSAALFIGSVTPVTRKFAQDTNNSVRNAIPPNATLLGLTYAIFKNNFEIALFGFIPILGLLVLLFIGFGTGLAFSGDALLRTTSQTPITGPELLFATMLFPFFFWELAGYALTMMEGIIITRGLIKGNRIERFIAPGHFRDGELFKALVILVMTAIVLIIAALMESYLIVVLG